MNWFVPLLLAALVAPTTASADWDSDTSSCGLLSTCPVDPCTYDAPPQAVDIVFHCVDVTPSRLPNSVDNVGIWTWWRIESTANTAYNPLDDLYRTGQVDLTPVNDPLCDLVWSRFCTDPLEYPEWQDAQDPFGPYPL